MDADILEILIKIALIVLVIAGVWLVVELALTIKRARGVVDTLDTTVADLNTSVNDTISNIQPVIKRLDTTVDNLQPTIQEVQPLLNKAGGTIDALSQNLLRLEEIVSDVSSVTSTAANATVATNDLASNATNVANSVLTRIKSKFGASARDYERTGISPDFSGEDFSQAVDRSSDDVEQLSFNQEEPQAHSNQYLNLEKNVVSDDAGYFKYPSQTK